ncbi:aminotransferase-like protein [Oryza sativa Japonica Group]|uniref:Aminotransferase-like protein n=1 Tax=Oryza sativa subsp. japonica TaxID=39947 RepID=Q5VNI2_ORYSJ|nr:aminotransferase-like protein [Oryza sativa Japonica Group]
MSTFASPPSSSATEYVEHLTHQVAIPSVADEFQFFLGPIGNLDPIEFINGETNRIPFRFANPDLSPWKGTFKSWPSTEVSWLAWYKRMLASKLAHWDEIDISQALALTAAKAASVSAVSKLSTEPFKEWFNNFYDGFPKNDRIWFAYEGSASFELTCDFRFDEINSEKYDKSREVFSTAISPCIIPVGIYQDKNIQMTYEFYHPTSAARQFGMGQLPISLFFADRIQSRGEISSFHMMDWLLNLPGPPLGNIDNIKLRTFRSMAFDRWWIEWKKHLFHQSPSMYLTNLFPDDVPLRPKAAAETAARCGWIDDDGGELRVDGAGGAPMICGGNGGRDEDGDDIAMLMKETATDGDDRSDSGTDWRPAGGGDTKNHAEATLEKAAVEGGDGDAERRSRRSFYRGLGVSMEAHGDRRREGKLWLEEEKSIRIELKSVGFQTKLAEVSKREKEEEIEEIISPQLIWPGKEGGGRILEGGGGLQRG